MRRKCVLMLATAVTALTLYVRVAVAVPPVELSTTGQLTDQAGVIQDGNRVEQALDGLRETERVQLFTVYVDTFDGLQPQQWADATAEQNGLGQNDMLLAVAVEDRQYAWSVGQQFPLTDTELQTLASEDIEPELQAGDWAGASLAAAQGLESRLGAVGGTSPTGNPGGGLGILLVPCIGAALVGIGIIVLIAGFRRRARRSSSEQEQQPAVAAVPTSELATRAGALLVEMDDALETSEQDVGFAEAEFGPQAASPFREALARARADVAEAFRVQQRLNDADPETDEERRRLLTEIIQRCERADGELEEHAERFEQLRDRATRAPEIAAAVEDTIETVGGRITAAQATVKRLQQAYPESAVTAVAAAPDQARERLEFARTSVQEARGAIDGGDSHRAADILSAAEEAAAQAVRLLDSVDATAAEQEAAAARLESEIAAMRQDIGAAEAVPAGSAQAAAVTAPLGAARVALADVTAAMSSGSYDPLAASRLLKTAAVPLDQALASQAQRAEQETRARQGLDELLVGLRARISAIHDFIVTNRGGVGAQARASLAEAQARITEATALRDADPVRALEQAKAAEAYAGQALQLAQSDVSQFNDGHPTVAAGGTGGMGDLGGMILGGILLGQLFGGGMGRGMGGGFQGGFGGRRGGFGRFSSGSFGGMASRRGGGGRF